MTLTPKEYAAWVGKMLTPIERRLWFEIDGEESLECSPEWWVVVDG